MINTNNNLYQLRTNEAERAENGFPELTRDYYNLLKKYTSLSEIQKIKLNKNLDNEIN